MPFESAQVASVFLRAPEQSKPAFLPAGVAWQQSLGDASGTDVGGEVRGASVGEEVRGAGVGEEVRGVGCLSKQRGSFLAKQNFFVQRSIFPLFWLQVHVLQPSK